MLSSLYKHLFGLARVYWCVWFVRSNVRVVVCVFVCLFVCLFVCVFVCLLCVSVY